MSERWKPECGETYYYIASMGVVSGYAWRDYSLDSLYYDSGNCFKTKAEAEAAAKKVKALLLSLHEPVTDCSQLPEWCKVGEWVYYFDEVDGHSYQKIDRIDGKYIYFYKKFDSSKPSDPSVSDRVVYSVFIENTKQAHLRPCNAKEMKALVGRAVDSDYGTFLVTKFYADGGSGEVCIDSIYYDADKLLDEFTIDNAPCGVLEHLNENGEWVE